MHDLYAYTHVRTFVWLGLWMNDSFTGNVCNRTVIE